MQILANLKKNYSHLFDFQDDFIIDGDKFDLYAKYHQENSKFFGSKRLEIYSFNNDEHLFVKIINDKTIDFKKLENFFMNLYNNFIVVDDKHMSSIITVIYIMNSIDDDTKKLIKKFSFYKSYKFGLKGFVNGKLIVLDMDYNKAYENRLAKGDAIKLKLLS